MTNHNCEAVYTKLELQFSLNGLLCFYTSIVKTSMKRIIPHISQSLVECGNQWFGSFTFIRWIRIFGKFKIYQQCFQSNFNYKYNNVCLKKNQSLPMQQSSDSSLLLLLPIHIFLYMNWLQVHTFLFHFTRLYKRETWYIHILNNFEFFW